MLAIVGTCNSLNTSQKETITRHEQSEAANIKSIAYIPPKPVIAS